MLSFKWLMERSMRIGEILLKFWGRREKKRTFVMGGLLLCKYESSCDLWWPILNTMVPPALYMYMCIYVYAYDMRPNIQPYLFILVTYLKSWVFSLPGCSSFSWRWEVSLAWRTSQDISLIYLKRASVSLLPQALQVFVEVSDDYLGYLQAYLFAPHMKQKGIC